MKIPPSIMLAIKLTLLLTICLFINRPNANAATYPQGMLAYWKFDEGAGNVVTDVISGYQGTINGAVWTAGRAGGALDFDGVNDLVRIDNFPVSTTFLQNEFTVELWLKMKGTSPARPYNTFIGDGEGFWGDHNLSFTYDFADKLWQFFYYPTDANGNFNITHDTGTDWNHVVIIYTATTQNFYINGTQVASRPIGPFNAPFPSSSILYIGASPGDSQYINAVIDEVALYNRALKPEEILHHYQNGLAGLGYEVQAPIPSLTFQGFEAPMNKGLVTVKKNRVLPLKVRLLDDNTPVTNSYIIAPPIIRVLYNSGTGDAIDVSDSALPAGQGTAGNQFEFDGTFWHFNLSTANYTAKGIYTIYLISGNAEEYIIASTYTAQFEL